MNLSALVTALAESKPELAALLLSRRLTMRQIDLLSGGDRQPAAPEPEPTEAEYFWRWGRLNKLPDYEIRRLWRERNANGQ